MSRPSIRSGNRFASLPLDDEGDDLPFRYSSSTFIPTNEEHSENLQAHSGFSVGDFEVKDMDDISNPPLIVLNDRTTFQKYEPEYTANIDEDVEVLQDIGVFIDYPNGRLGEGLFGVVYRGYYGINVDDFENVNPSHRFAVKVIDFSEEYNQSNRETFESEKYILTEVNHKNVVKIIMIVNMGEQNDMTYEDFPDEIYPSPDRAYLFMDYADQGELKRWLNNNYNSFEPSIRIKFIRDLFDGMRYLHHHFILHGDVHTGNVLIFTEEDELVAKWTDFGLSSIASTNQYRYRNRGITVQYFNQMSPFEVMSLNNVFEKILQNRYMCRSETPEEAIQLNECLRMIDESRNLITIDQLFNQFRHILE